MAGKARVAVVLNLTAARGLEARVEILVLSLCGVETLAEKILLHLPRTVSCLGRSLHRSWHSLPWTQAAGVLGLSLLFHTEPSEGLLFLHFLGPRVLRRFYPEPHLLVSQMSEWEGCLKTLLLRILTW